jgi:hypothetical protein
MTAYAMIKTQVLYLGDNYPRWGYEIEVSISTTVMENGAYYATDSALRCKRTFMDGSLDVVRPLDPYLRLGAGERGPDILFREHRYHFANSDLASEAAASRAKLLVKELDQIRDQIASSPPASMEHWSWG